ncbi:MAG: ribosome biogenesis GTPase Der [bacterium]
MSLPVVAIVGRPNVGKSTLFNRLVRKREAIVDDLPGVTRDRLYAVSTWEGHAFTVIDTGGFELGSTEKLVDQMRDQTEIAIQEADLILYIMDAKEGPLGVDREIIRRLYRAAKPILFVVNKVDNPAAILPDFYSLGVSFIPISAEHALGISDLVDEIGKHLPSRSVSPQKEPKDSIRVAIVGRPNVGKSSLVNSLLRQERMLVTDIPGTTRDAVDSYLKYNQRQYTLIDTAGIRRKGKTGLALEKYSVILALKHLETCDVALVLIDAVEGVTSQDATIVGYAYEGGKPCILVVNKWDLITKDSKTMGNYVEKIRYELKYVPFAPIVFVSAFTGQRVFTIFPIIERIYDQYTRRISTSVLNRAVQQIVRENPPPLYRGRRIKFYYQTQISTKPPTFLFFANYPEEIHFSYKRYLQNRLRDLLELENIPLRIYFRMKDRKG